MIYINNWQTLKHFNVIFIDVSQLTKLSGIYCNDQIVDYFALIKENVSLAKMTFFWTDDYINLIVFNGTFYFIYLGLITINGDYKIV